jgi:hypothetical protein
VAVVVAFANLLSQTRLIGADKMTSQPHQSGPFPIQHAFVLQFAAHTALDAAGLEGRIEHVVSGRATRFQSLEALLAFVTQVLEAHTSPQRGEPGHAFENMFAPHTET